MSIAITKIVIIKTIDLMGIRTVHHTKFCNGFFFFFFFIIEQLSFLETVPNLVGGLPLRSFKKKLMDFLCICKILYRNRASDIENYFSYFLFPFCQLRRNNNF